MALFSKNRVNRSKATNVLQFDEKRESELLSEYLKHRGSKTSHEYYSALPLIDFYYRYRDLGNRYLDLCIQYCEVCISLLSEKDMESYISSGIRIPAFQKLVIIYEKQGMYKNAIEIAMRAVEYDREKEYYQKKILTLSKKLEEKSKKKTASLLAQ